jgi:site-specific DNA recombinase
MKKAVIMSRVSSDEQAKGFSLDVQAESLIKHCEKNDLEIIYTIKEDHSAKSFDRPEFKKFLKFAQINRGKIDFLLVTSWDRFSRNLREALEVMNKLSKLGIEVRAIEQPLDMKIPENKLLLAMYLSMPEIDNDRRSIKIKGGIRGAWKAGRWTNVAPWGYKNSRDEDNKPILQPGPNAPHVKFIFKELANGRPQVEIILKLKKKGVNIAKSTMSDLVSNPVYMGKIRVPALLDEPAYLANGIHPPLITPELFYTVQEVVLASKGKNLKPFVTTRRDELPLRGNLSCSKCGGSVTGSASRNRIGIRYFYYHCNHCSKERFRADAANAAVEEILKEFNFKTEIQDLYVAMSKDFLGKSETSKNIDGASIKKQVGVLQTRLENLQDKFADNQISFEEYQNLKSRYDEQLLKLNAQLSDNKHRDKVFSNDVLKSISKIPNLHQIYIQADLEGKNRLLCSIFPKKFEFDGEKCRTQYLNSIILRMLLLDKGSRKIKTGQLFQNLVLSGLVENTGVEPVTSCMPCKRSSQLS